VILTSLWFSQTVYGNGCIECHSNSDFYVQERKLHTYYQDWLSSPHREAGLTCDFCHGGDVTAVDRDSAHQSILKLSDPESRLYYKNLPTTCGSCHSEKLAAFEQSKHYRALMEDRTAPSCTTCHRAMHPKPHYRDIIAQSCRACHFPENPEQLPQVADRADEYLHRLSIAKVYMSWVANFYEKQGWPYNTREEIELVKSNYQAAVTRVHRFDLETLDENSAEILAELEEMFKQAWDEKPTPD
jgi:hypothetical protein